MSVLSLNSGSGSGPRSFWCGHSLSEDIKSDLCDDSAHVDCITSRRDCELEFRKRKIFSSPYAYLPTLHLLHTLRCPKLMLKQLVHRQLPLMPSSGQPFTPPFGMPRGTASGWRILFEDGCCCWRDSSPRRSLPPPLPPPPRSRGGSRSPPRLRLEAAPPRYSPPLL